MSKSISVCLRQKTLCHYHVQRTTKEFLINNSKSVISGIGPSLAGEKRVVPTPIVSVCVCVRGHFITIRNSVFG
jgi:hypothetical protein